jgi:hypothetical protein
MDYDDESPPSDGLGPDKWTKRAEAMDELYDHYMELVRLISLALRACVEESTVDFEAALMMMDDLKENAPEIEITMDSDEPPYWN